MVIRRILPVLLATLAAWSMNATADTPPAATKEANPTLSGSVYRAQDKRPNSVWFWPVAVDGSPLGSRASMGPYITSPGVHSITVQGGFQAGAMVETMAATVVFTVDLQPGRAYAVNGEIQDDTLVAWLVDASSGVRLPYSGVAEWGPEPRRMTMPIVIPIR
ncbi:MAG: hypothetical protein AB1899_06185 [Pseudomonadota bacterium]